MAFRTLHPDGHQGPVADDDPNDRSVVLHVSWQGVDLLLTGDAPEAAEAAFAAAAGEVEILKVGHHGSRTSTGERLLARSRPRVALIPVGRGNRYGHPHPVVTGRLARAGVEVWRTDLHGAVRVRIDRRGRWRVEAERGRPGTGRADSDAFGTNVRR
jgi:competence protein ComEC